MPAVHNNELQYELNLFIPPSFTSLSRTLHLDSLVFHPSRRLKTRWHVTINKHSGIRELHYPSVLDDSPESVKHALLYWATMPYKRNKQLLKAYREKRLQYESIIRAYLDDHSSVQRITRFTQSQSETAGTIYDLKEVFNHINATFFNKKLCAYLKWGSPFSKTSFQKTHRDPDGIEWYSITIAGMYNLPGVPRFAIEAILYHEMLHIHVPPEIKNGRRIVHGTTFKNMEKQFPEYKKWRKWELTILPDLIKKAYNNAKKIK